MDLNAAKRILGLTFRISKDELKSLYRQKAKELHPDINKSPNASVDFRMLQDAFEFLEDRLSLLPKEHVKKTFSCPVIYRILGPTKNHVVHIPYESTKDDDLVVHFMYKSEEFRIMLEKGQTIPLKIHITDIDIFIKFEYSRYE